MKSRLIGMIILVSFCTTAVPLSVQESRLQQNHSLDYQSVPSSPETKKLRSDLERMQALLEQMQRNVAFVTPGDTPLKHQFQLEIDMWQLLIRDMEKNAAAQQSQ